MILCKIQKYKKKLKILIKKSKKNPKKIQKVFEKF